MKKIIPFLALFCLMMLGVSALVTYTGIPQFPYIIFGIVNWNTQPLGGVRVELTNLNTGYSTIINTNIDGYWQEDGSNWLTNNAARPPILFGDSIKVKTLDGCGSADTCEITFTAFSVGNENSARKDLSVTGALLPIPSSDGGSSGGGGGGSSGGGGGGSVTAWNCQEWTPCENSIQLRICTQNQFTRKEKKDCIVSSPEPIVTPPIEEPVIPVTPEQYTCLDGTKVDVRENCPKYTCSDGTLVDDLAKCPTTPITPPEPESNLLTYLIILIAGILAFFGWGKGFAGLIKYKLKQADEAEKAGNKELAKKYRATAEKMAKSIVTNYLAGKYKK